VNERFAKGKRDMSENEIKRIKRKRCPDKFEHDFCPLTHA
jgi:hypothetical protein